MNSRKILVAEDDAHIRQGLVDILESEGYQVDSAANGNEAGRLLRANRYDLALLDVMMPGTDGYSLCQQTRAADPKIALIFVTAKGQEIDKVLGLKLGADDYITKPFGVNELLARVEVALRRSAQCADAPSNSDPLPETFSLGPLTVDRGRYRIASATDSSPLTARELALLESFFRQPDKVLTRDHLLNEVWGQSYFGTTRTLDQHIAQLRKKLSQLDAPATLIETVHGVGYRYRPPNQ